MKYVLYILVGLVVIIGLIAAAGAYKFNYLANQPGHDVDGNKVTVTSYDECVAAGYPVMESYPEQCSDGETTFVNQVEPVVEEENSEVGEVELQAAPSTPGDTDVIIGMTIAEVEVYAAEQAVPFRLGYKDGEYLAVTMDYRPGRITASVENGVVFDYSVE